MCCSVFNTGKTVDTLFLFNKGVNAMENLNKDRSLQLALHSPATVCSGCLMSLNDVNDKGRRYKNTGIFKENCFLQMLPDLQNGKSVHRHGVSVLPKLASEDIPRDLSTMHKRWITRIQLSKNLTEETTQPPSVVMRKIELNPAEGGSTSVTQPADTMKSLDHQLKSPHGLSITRHGDIVVADRSDKVIKIFSSSGECLRKFGGGGSLVGNWHCVLQGEYLVVSGFDDHCIEMFDLEGNFLFKFGMKGNKDGEFSKPALLSANKKGLLMVCDYFNHRVQVFGLSGKFITKFGSEGSRAGEVPTPVAIASLCDGRVVVSDGHNHRIVVFDQMCSLPVSNYCILSQCFS